MAGIELPDLGSLSGAARHMGLSQTMITKHLAALEADGLVSSSVALGLLLASWGGDLAAALVPRLPRLAEVATQATPGATGDRRSTEARARRRHFHGVLNRRKC